MQKVQKVETVLKTIVGNSHQSSVAEGVSKQYNTGAAVGRDHIDAINQMFAEFELAYHNQYHKAYAQEGSVALAKKYWLSCLSDLSPDIILLATKKVVSSQEFLPSVASIIKACGDGISLFGLPSNHSAYLEACRAPLPKSAHQWSHPAVYFAGKATGWFELANQVESQIFPLFDYHYRLLCDRVVKGESLEVQLPEALPDSGSVLTSKEESISRLDALRKILE